VTGARRHLLLVAAALLLGLALLLALLARDVRAWESSVERGDRRFQIGPGPDRLWEPSARFAGAGKAVLGLEDDLRFRTAAQWFRRSQPRRAASRTPRDLAESTTAQVQLAAVERRDELAARRSAAANLAGVLALTDALTDTTQAATLARRSATKFRDAIRLDPSNADAQANLELVLTLLRTQDPRVDPEGIAGGGAGAGSGSGSGGQGF
jgi:hypothetical protein